jgi:hypothetical protein
MYFQAITRNKNYPLSYRKDSLLNTLDSMFGQAEDSLILEKYFDDVSENKVKPKTLLLDKLKYNEFVIGITDQIPAGRVEKSDAICIHNVLQYVGFGIDLTSEILQDQFSKSFSAITQLGRENCHVSIITKGSTSEIVDQNLVASGLVPSDFHI